MTRVVAPFASPMLRAARMIPEGPGGIKKELTSEQKRTARHMAHSGASLREIKAALGVVWVDQTLRKRLYAINIRPRNRSNKLHSGEDGSLWGNGGKIEQINQQPYRPREVSK